VIQINERCRCVSKQYLGKVAQFWTGLCSACGSISAYQLEDFIDNGVDGRYSYPLNGMVDYVELVNGSKFYLYHLWDEPVTEDEYARIFGKIEDLCGNYKMYIKKMAKY
jgi:hypothetical protein